MRSSQCPANGAIQERARLPEPRLDRGNPWIAASRAGQIEPKAITPSAICGVKPKIAIATGMTAEAGRGRRNSRVGAIYSRAAFDVPISAPSATPTIDAASQPPSMWLSVPASFAPRVPRKKPCPSAHPNSCRRRQENRRDKFQSGNSPQKAINAT